MGWLGSVQHDDEQGNKKGAVGVQLILEDGGAKKLNPCGVGSIDRMAGGGLEELGGARRLPAAQDTLDGDPFHTRLLPLLRSVAVASPWLVAA
jgi:hypothetical protein